MKTEKMLPVGCNYGMCADSHDEKYKRHFYVKMRKEDNKNSSPFVMQ